MKKGKKVKAVAEVAFPWGEPYGSPGNPIWQLPRTKDAYDAMLEQMRVAYLRDDGGLTEGLGAALESIGIKRPKG